MGGWERARLRGMPAAVIPNHITIDIAAGVTFWGWDFSTIPFAECKHFPIARVGPYLSLIIGWSFLLVDCSVAISAFQPSPSLYLSYSIDVAGPS
jgi:hypothetical protein